MFFIGPIGEDSCKAACSVHLADVVQNVFSRRRSGSGSGSSSSIGIGIAEVALEAKQPVELNDTKIWRILQVAWYKNANLEAYGKTYLQFYLRIAYVDTFNSTWDRLMNLQCPSQHRWCQRRHRQQLYVSLCEFALSQSDTQS